MPTHEPEMEVTNEVLPDCRSSWAAPVDVLGICTSMKPAPGFASRSAAREYLRYALSRIDAGSQRIGYLDLREHHLPLFDGRSPDQHESAAVRKVFSAVKHARSILLSVPCYWGGPSGVFKNFIDVLCGALYDLGPDAQTVFRGKRIGLFVIGADHQSAHHGCEDARRILSMTGAIITGEPVILSNPRCHTSGCERALSDLIALGGALLE